MSGSNIANQDQEIAESRERFDSDISDEDRKRLLLLLGAEMDKACITWQPGAVINPVLRAILRAEQDTRERCAQRWISVETDLPDPSSYVWFWVPSLGENGGWECGYFRADRDDPIQWECERTAPQDELIRYDHHQVTHWMLAILPSPVAERIRGKGERACG